MISTGKGLVRIRIQKYFNLNLSFCVVIATYVEKMKILDYFMIAHRKECDYRINLLPYTIAINHMVKNVIKGSFPISKVLVFEGNSYGC